MSTMDKVTERTFNIAENKKEMSEEQPKPSLNLPWKCHTSTAWRSSSEKKQTYSRTLQCDENPIRTRSRKAPKGSQLQRPLLPKNNEPLVCLPPLLPHCPLLCPPLMAVRLWKWIPTAVLRSHQVLRSPILLGTVRTPSAPSQREPPSVPTPPTRPGDPQDEQTAVPAQKGVQAGAPQISRSFCDEILTVLSTLPEEWPLVKIDLILNKAETYYVSWRRFLYLNERLRTLDADPAARTINRNKGRILEHLVHKS